MALPYQCLTALGKGGILCAARGTSIYTFDLASDSRLLSTWNHPSTRQFENGKAQVAAQENEQPKESESDQPPAKKRRLGSEDKSKSEETSQHDAGSPASGHKKQKPKPAPPRQEIPFIILLIATEDGSYVIAVTGDKVVWVFEHSGQGMLKESSQRSMPKRPSSISLTDDEKTILCADKFGDVYALPVVPPPPSATDVLPSVAPATAPPRAAPKGANTLTVHSQRNLRALEEQRKVREQREKKAKPGTAHPDASSSATPEHQHELLLGHVSMLTAVAAATLEGKPYILTADRDEHIRVSRGIPQAHVVETYCLGHEAFLSALCIPRPGSPHLVSGGGDPALFLWEWHTGRLLGTADLLGPVQEASSSPGAAKVALSRLCSYDTEDGTYVVAICERVPAMFIYQLHASPTANLTHVQTLRLAGNPLDIAVIRYPVPRLIVSIDDVESIRAFALDNGTCTAQGSIQSSVPLASTSLELPRPELDKLLYTVENLRKTSFEDRAEEGEGEDDEDEGEGLKAGGSGGGDGGEEGGQSVGDRDVNSAPIPNPA
ncbi:hypothetical protein F4810DRAFT_653732 [Camillea tinctor]|nr:hypothetical protein F4810DRAFT_653732 [Camillea tinctor]